MNVAAVWHGGQAFVALRAVGALASSPGALALCGVPDPATRDGDLAVRPGPTTGTAPVLAPIQNTDLGNTQRKLI